MASLVKAANLSLTSPRYGKDEQGIGDTESNVLNTLEGVQLSNELASLGSVETSNLVILSVGNRPAGAGLHLLWGTWNSEAIDYPPVRGLFMSATWSNSMPSGNYSQPATYFTPSNATRSISIMDNAVGGPKYAQLYLGDRKPSTWQKHVWYAENAQALGAPRREDPDWIGAWWSADGLDVMKGCFDLLTYYYDNLLTSAQQSRIIGIRFNYNAIVNEGDTPGSTLNDIDHAAWTQGSLAGARPNDYTTTEKNIYLNSLVVHVLDTVMAEGDSGDPAYPVLIRPGTKDDTTASVDTRLTNLWTNDKVGLIITSLEHQPRSSFHEGQMEDMRTYCKTQGGNTRALTEAFGENTADSDVEANFSMLQFQYWMSLCALSIGATYVCWRVSYAENYNLVGNDTLRDEWRESMNFVTKYAGYQQYPAQSPGAWCAFREGNRLTGNYDFLMTQIITGGGDRGTELWAGTNGTAGKHDFPQGDYVGPGSQIGYGADGSDSGQGQRQSAWAFEFAAAETLKLQLDAGFTAGLNGKDVRLRIHWLDINGGGVSFQPELFGQTMASQAVGTDDSWYIYEDDLTNVTVVADGDGAHIVVDFTGGPVILHMVELEII